MAPLHATMLRTLFLFFVTFAVFAVVNVVTGQDLLNMFSVLCRPSGSEPRGLHILGRSRGVFVDTAIEKNQSDKELAVQEELRNKRLRHSTTILKSKSLG